MSRGDRRELIFLDEKDRQQFLFTLGQACGKTGWQVHDALAPARLICYPHRFDRPSRSSHASIVEDLLAAPCCFLHKALVPLAQGNVAAWLRRGGLCTQVRAALDPRVRLGASNSGNADTIGYDVRRAETFDKRIGCDRDDREL